MADLQNIGFPHLKRQKPTVLRNFRRLLVKLETAEPAQMVSTSLTFLP